MFCVHSLACCFADKPHACSPRCPLPPPRWLQITANLSITQTLLAAGSSAASSSAASSAAASSSAGVAPAGAATTSEAFAAFTAQYPREEADARKALEKQLKSKWSSAHGRDKNQFINKEHKEALKDDPAAIRRVPVTLMEFDKLVRYPDGTPRPCYMCGQVDFILVDGELTHYPGCCGWDRQVRHGGSTRALALA